MRNYLISESQLPTFLRSKCHLFDKIQSVLFFRAISCITWGGSRGKILHDSLPLYSWITSFRATPFWILRAFLELLKVLWHLQKSYNYFLWVIRGFIEKKKDFIEETILKLNSKDKEKLGKKQQKRNSGQKKEFKDRMFYNSTNVRKGG